MSVSSSRDGMTHLYQYLYFAIRTWSAKVDVRPCEPAENSWDHSGTLGASLVLHEALFQGGVL